MNSWSRRLSLLVVPALGIVGLLSALVSMRFWFDSLHVDPSEKLFRLLQSLLLSVAVFGVLRAFRMMRGWRNLCLLTAVIISAHLLLQLLDARLPQQVQPCLNCSPNGFFVWEAALRFFIVSEIVFVAVAMMVKPQGKGPLIPLAAAVFAIPGSLLFGALVSWAQWEKMDLVLNEDVLGLLWQPTLALFLGVVAWISSAAAQRSQG